MDSFSVYCRKHRDASQDASDGKKKYLIFFI